MEIKRISRHVGHDGTNYFCWNCYRAGFDTPSQVNGHQSVCSARQIPVTTLPVDTSVATTLGGGGGTPTTRQEVEAPTSSSDIQTAIVRQELADIRADMKAQYSRVFNEIPHQQAVNSYGFLGISKEVWTIIAVVGYVLYSVGKESTCHCPAGTGTPTRRLSSIKDRVTDKAITYGLNKFFK